MCPAEFEPAIPETEQPQTHTLDLAATGIGFSSFKSARESEDIWQFVSANTVHLHHARYIFFVKMFYLR